MTGNRKERTLEIFFRGLRGENISISKFADEYSVSEKNISRSISELKNFLAEHRDLVGNAELRYSYQDKCYHLIIDDFLNSKELYALVEVMIGARAFSKMELLELVEKLKRFTTTLDRHKMQELIRREMYHYPEVKHDCDSVIESLWQIVDCIVKDCEISIDYYRMDRIRVNRRIRPASIMFTDHYFYLIAFKTDSNIDTPYYFRVDRIIHITKHRKGDGGPKYPEFDEGMLRRRSLFMFPGKLQTIRFEYRGPSVQAVLDKLPTSKVIERKIGGAYLMEAEVYGDGIKMWLLSQGSWITVIAPQDFVDEMRSEIKKMLEAYGEVK